MDNTPNLGLPYILAAQSQKHVTHNEAIRALDAVVQLAVLDRDLAAPPVSPAEGDRYIVAASPTGDWDSQAGNIAVFQDGAWAFLTPNEGWIAWIADEEAAVVWSNSSWTTLTAGGSGDGNFTTVGINATADTTNRLSLASPTTLFNHEGAGHQFKINKASASDTASLLYQTAFSGRAEMGTAGDDDFHFKVSPDGSTWKEAILINSSTGVVTFPFTAFAGLVWRGAWATSTSYAVNDAVENDGSSYVCRQAHTSGSDDDEPGVGANAATYWDLFAAKGTVDINGLTEEPGFTSGDFLMFWDTSASALRKVDYDNLPSGGGGGTVDTFGSPVANDFARFTDANTIEGRSSLEVRSDLGLVIGTDVQAHSAVLDATTASFTTADETKLDGVESGATADQTGSEILAELLPVDGTGSGLDADLLDGNEASAFALASHGHSAAQITSGAFADARIALSNVTQHQAAIDHDALTNFVANEHVDHTSVTFSAGAGLSGGGDLAANRSFAVDINGLTEEAGFISGDFLMFWDTSAGGLRKVNYDNLPAAGGPSFEGSWVTSTAYVVDDIVENNGSSYICLQAHTSGSDDDEPGVGVNTATYWGLLAAKGADAMNYSDDDLISGFNIAAMTDVSDTEIIAAQGVGVRLFVTQITVHNAHGSVDTGVAIKDGSTEIYRIPASSVYGGATLNFSAPLRLSDNAALQAACLVTGASVHVSASGFKKAA